MKLQKSNEVWMRASVAGSLWAAFEIVVGSFLHNLHFPFTGMVMASAGVILLTSFSVLWEMKEIFWRAGIVCALMKSISPSAVILGPMAGIMLEALLIQFFVIVFGRNILGYVAGGIAALLSLLIHKITGMLFSYGFDFVIILENTVAFILNSFSLQNLEPIFVLYFYAGVLIILGITSSLFGYYIGRNSGTMEIKVFSPIEVSDKKLKHYNDSKSRGIFYLPAAIMAVLTGLVCVSNYDLKFSSVLVALFIISVFLLYPEGLKPLFKTSVLINLVILVMFSVLFFDYKNSGINWSDEGFFVGIKMLFRTIFVISGFTVISIELRNPIIRKFLNEKSALYDAVQTGFSILPSIISGLPPFKEMVSRPGNTLYSSIAGANTFINNLYGQNDADNY